MYLGSIIIVGKLANNASNMVVALWVHTNNLDFSYFPNPVSNEFTINAATKLSSVSVINVLGQIVYSTTPNTNKVIVNMSELNAGYYFVKVVSGNASKTIKVIKN